MDELAIFRDLVDVGAQRAAADFQRCFEARIVARSEPSMREVPIQVNGRLRDRLEVSAEATESEIEALALASPKVRAALEGRTPKRVIHAGGRLVNIVG